MSSDDAQKSSTPLPMSTHSYVNQPGVSVTQGLWISVPEPIPGVPLGLEYLTQVDSIIIQQIIEVLEVLIGFERKNRYSLKNRNGQEVFLAGEQSSCMMRYCCGPNRSFSIKIFDTFHREVIRITRPYKCLSYLLCSNECTIESPPGQPIGTVEQKFSICRYLFDVKDHTGKILFRIEGPNCCLLNCACCAEKPFTIYGKDREIEIGCITKKYGGILKECFTDADTFQAHFPLDLDVRCKALLLGATFLIDFMIFESTKSSPTSTALNFVSLF